MVVSIPPDLYQHEHRLWQWCRKAIEHFGAGRSFTRLETTTAGRPWPTNRICIESFAGLDFLAASRGKDFSWFGPLERQATTIFCHFLGTSSQDLRVRRAEALGRALGVLSATETLVEAIVAAEHRCGPRHRHRADIYVRMDTGSRTVVVIIEAKFDHHARNPWASYEALRKGADDWHGFILAPRSTAEIAAVSRTRKLEWTFTSWRKLLRNLDYHLDGIDEDDFRRFRATLLRKSEGIKA